MNTRTLCAIVLFLTGLQQPVRANNTTLDRDKECSLTPDLHRMSPSQLGKAIVSGKLVFNDGKTIVKESFYLTHAYTHERHLGNSVSWTGDEWSIDRNNAVLIYPKYSSPHVSERLISFTNDNESIICRFSSSGKIFSVSIEGPPIPYIK